MLIPDKLYHKLIKLEQELGHEIESLLNLEPIKISGVTGIYYNIDDNWDVDYIVWSRNPHRHKFSYIAYRLAHPHLTW